MHDHLSSYSPELRDRYTQLDEQTARGGLLHGPSTTISLPADELEWADILAEAEAEFKASRPPGKRDGLAAVITAGAPGAGKSTARSTVLPNLHDYRVIDPDEARDALLTVLLAKGFLTDLPKFPGGRLTPREVSGLIHQQAIDIADNVRLECIAQGENIVVDGTFSWALIVDQTEDELLGGAHAPYRQLIVLDVEVDAEIAIEQSTKRWASDLESDLGGRFIRPSYIRQMCQVRADGRTVMQANAEELCQRASAAGVDTTLHLFKNGVQV